MKLIDLKKSLSIVLFALLWLLMSFQTSKAGPFRNWVSKHHSDQQDISEKVTLPSGVNLIQDIPYGKDNKQKMDVYLPVQAQNAPVIFMVHGGAWRAGDKANKQVVTNKVNRWTTKGIIFVSVNYRLVPKVDPLEQVADIKRALSVAQKKALDWGGDPSKIVLMGHSAGAHLVSVLATLPSNAFGFEVKPWLGVISIDSACLNVVERMEAKHFRLYDKAFGNDINYWVSVSPFHLLDKVQAPFLAICSTRRNDSCSQATKYINKASSIGMSAKVLKINMSHKGTNEQLGKNNIYTKNVESFLATLDNSLKQVLTNKGLVPSRGTSARN